VSVWWSLPTSILIGLSKLSLVTVGFSLALLKEEQNSTMQIAEIVGGHPWRWRSEKPTRHLLCKEQSLDN